ncbi:MAG: AAA family ATPase [Thermoguttaceae bacterium]
MKTNTASSEHASLETLERLADLRRRIVAEVGRTIVGHTAALDELLTVLLAEGHAIIVGVPGLAKTLLVRTVVAILGVPIGRIQCTPDMLPADVIGGDTFIEVNGKREVVFRRGPVFTNILLADEINRASPKTQSALLEAMQERQVTFGQTTFPLPRPFSVLATRNPIELEGTYPLPEAQLDRFTMEIDVGYPQAIDDEIEIAVQPMLSPEVVPQTTLDEWITFQEIVDQVPMARHLVEYVATVVRRSRPDDAAAPEIVKRYVRWGISPRGAQTWCRAAKAHAALFGRPTVTTDDIQAIANSVLRHRLVTHYSAEVDCVTHDDILRELRG